MTLFSGLNHPHNVLRLLAVISLMGAVLTARAQATLEGDDLFGQIQSLQEQMHIEISGLERIQNEAKVRAYGNLDQQLSQLLAGFNYITSRNKQGKLAHIAIINKKTARENRGIVLPTRQEGKHLMVSVALSGDGRLWQTVDMLIDTGADLVVLPESMIAPLGLSESQFTLQKMQTANGLSDAKIGVLQELKIAGETVFNVEVAFVADRLLGNTRLLGMSVLGRYQMAIDDNLQAITLIKKAAR
ncbi:retropepsin-like aspartic protease family protein [Methylovulum psychrotolerans]|uniref:TIGR02281 family clan AA aspartic protease n=1 Tax=Methylovulum psychrotolerans TaxID=1704499 RepID=A0A1Z4BUA3_9GAMM|nr:retropepsin-like aspartic protease [Methylovulum psychrotolerans]ASF44820.1 TIGR02281 family clan AA aspartic protease [Methylovulum psychrotolerans]